MKFWRGDHLCRRLDRIIGLYWFVKEGGGRTVSDPSLCLLGPPLWHGTEGTVVLRPSKPNAVALVLAAQPGRLVARGQLLSLLWDEVGEAEGRGALNTTLTRARRSWPAMPIRSEGDYLFWESSQAVETDGERFERWKSHGRLAEAAALWRGPFLHGFDLTASAAFDDWLEQWRQHWAQQQLEILEQLCEDLAKRQAWAEVARYAEAALKIDPYDERFYRRMLQSHYFLGNKPAALARFKKFQHQLQLEFKASPAPETLRMATAMASGEPLIPPPSPPTAPSVRALLPLREAPLGTPRLPLFGRHAQLAALQQALDRALQTGGRLVAITGEMGIGKTRLIQALFEPESHFLPKVSTVLAGHCYETSVELPYGPLIEILARCAPTGGKEVTANLSVLLPQNEREGVEEGASQSSLDRLRLFEYLKQTLTSWPSPTLLIIEDLQWADQATMHFLPYLLRHPRPERVAVLATVRSGTARPEVEELLWQLEYEGRCHRIHLGPISREATAALVAETAGVRDTEVLDALWSQTQGNPLFAILCAQAVTAHGTAQVDSEDLPIPEAIQKLVLVRLNRLSPPAQDLARAASIFPRPMSLEALAATAQMEEATLVEAIETLQRLGLIEETAAPSSLICETRDFSPPSQAFRFSHHLIRRAILKDLSTARAQLLHRRAFQYLVQGVQQLAASEVTLAGMETLAYHATEGGLASEALTWSLRAADAAESVFAYADAARFLRQALSQLRHLPPNLERLRLGIDLRLRLTEMGLSSRPAELMDWIGQAATAALDKGHRVVEAETLQAITLGMQGKLNRALNLLEHLVRLSEKTGNRTLVALSKMYYGQLLGLRGNFPAAVEILAQVIPMLDQLGRERDAALTRCTWATLVSALGRTAEGRNTLMRVAEACLARGNAATAAYAYCHLTVNASLCAEWENAVGWCQAAVELAEKEHQPLHGYVAKVFQGLPVARLGNLREGIRLQEEAIELGRRIRLRLLVDRSYAFLAMMQFEAGNLDLARKAASTGLEIARTDGYLVGVAMNIKMLGQIALASQNPEGVSHLQTALQHFTQISMTPEVARCHAALALAAQTPEERAYHAGQATAMFTQTGLKVDLARLTQALEENPSRLEPAFSVW